MRHKAASFALQLQYREDYERKLRLKTIELIIDKSPLITNVSKIPANKIMSVRVKYGEVHLGRAIKSAGGRWNRNRKVWELPYQEVQALGLEKRIVEDDVRPKVSNNRNFQKRSPPKVPNIGNFWGIVFGRRVNC